MKKKIFSVLLVVIMGLSFAMPSYAQMNKQNTIVSSDSPFVTTDDGKMSQYFQVQPRGTIISTGILQISNKGDGHIGVYMQTLTHQEVDATTFGVYADRWIESEQRWANVASYKFSYTKEDNPDDDLTVKSISFDIVGQPADCYYRLRGAHLVSVGDTREMLSSQTDGILITKD